VCNLILLILCTTCLHVHVAHCLTQESTPASSQQQPSSERTTIYHLLPNINLFSHQQQQFLEQNQICHLPPNIVLSYVISISHHASQHFGPTQRLRDLRQLSCFNQGPILHLCCMAQQT
jgi:hypothetical protein